MFLVPGFNALFESSRHYFLLPGPRLGPPRDYTSPSLHLQSFFGIFSTHSGLATSASISYLKIAYHVQAFSSREICPIWLISHFSANARYIILTMFNQDVNRSRVRHAHLSAWCLQPLKPPCGPPGESSKEGPRIKPQSLEQMTSI